MKPENSGKFESVPWQTLAIGAYLVHNFEPDELAAPDGVTAAQHLELLLSAEFSADIPTAREMSRELGASVLNGGVDVVRWDRQQVLTWIIGQFMWSIDYNLLAELIGNDNEDIQTSRSAQSAGG